MMDNPTGIDAFHPVEISERVEKAGVAKARLPAVQTFTLAVLAGLFIGLGAVLFTVVMTGVDSTYGPARVLGGLAFSLGLILVVVAGAELFTGNALMVMAAVDKRITVAELGRNWAIVYFGNFIGAVLLALGIVAAGIITGSIAETATAIVRGKMRLSE